MLLKRSQADSARFDLVVVRGRIEHDDPLPCPADIERSIHDLQADVAILRAPAGSMLQSTLGALPWPSLHADTLVYYEKTIASESPARPRGDWIVAEAVAENQERIESIARSSFAGYRSHYHVNPVLDHELILQGYAEWAITYLSHPSPERLTFIVREAERIHGFLTCRHNAATASCEVVLNAVAPDAAGRGVYSFLLAESLRLLSHRGVQRAEISTQVWNYAVQKVWARQGFALTKAYDTYHVNAMLGSRQCR